jgi:multidrug efflux pump subunit AcrA (membrane-fusion protein)
VSETTSRGRDQEISRREEHEDGFAPTSPPRRRRRWVAATIVALVLLGAGAGAALAAGAFNSNGTSTTNTGAAPPATFTVTRQNISSTTSENATLGYAGTYTVLGQGGGALTWLPSSGQDIRQGQVLYRVDNGTPTVLMYGSVPAWRSLSEGATGADVAQLNHDLVTLGYGNSSNIQSLGWDYYSWATKYAVEGMEAALGVSKPSGSLPLGSVVFKPEALRVTQVTANLGSPAGGAILSATSERQIVTINLSTSNETQVKVGDAVSVSLPSGSSTPGVISSVGSVASTTGSGSSSSATVLVSVTLTNPSAAGSLDQAPVTVYITTSNASNVLVVEVGALLAQPSGGYAVEVVGPNNSRRMVPVTVGLFDDNAGLVQVTGNLTPGERVVVPNT